MDTRHRLRGGFTLFELAVVVAMIAIVMAIALPQLAPALMTGRLEGAARRLAGYGRAALAQSAFSKEPLILRVDMAKGEYWTVRRVLKENSLFNDDDDTARGEEDDQANLPLTKETLMAALNEGNLDEQSERLLQVEEQFNQYFRYALEARARNVKHEGFLSDINPLEGVELDLDDEDGEVEEEVKSALLERTYLPEEVHIQRVIIGSEEFTEGVVDIEITPMGLYETVEMEVASDEGGRYRVTLDPITGGTHLAREDG